MTKIVKQLSKIIVTVALLPHLLIVQPSYGQSFVVASSDSVTLGRAEADSLLLMLDTYETSLRLSNLELRQCRELSALDSLIFEQYKASTKETWMDRILGQPIVWFVLGVWIGAQAIVYAGD